jgi:hypothetical protein
MSLAERFDVFVLAPDLCCNKTSLVGSRRGCGTSPHCRFPSGRRGYVPQIEYSTSTDTADMDIFLAPYTPDRHPMHDTWSDSFQ